MVSGLALKSHHVALAIHTGSDIKLFPTEREAGRVGLLAKRPSRNERPFLLAVIQSPLPETIRSGTPKSRLRIWVPGGAAESRQAATRNANRNVTEPNHFLISEICEICG